MISEAQTSRLKASSPPLNDEVMPGDKIRLGCPASSVPLSSRERGMLSKGGSSGLSGAGTTIVKYLTIEL
jgi:hypothetical protein